MRYLILVVAVAMLGGCGVDTATTAATGARIKKQELEDGKRTQERAQQKIDEMMEQMRQMQQAQQQAQQAGDAGAR